MPAVIERGHRGLGPFAPLARRLGALAMDLAGGRAERIVLSYRGRLAEHDTRLLTVAALNGVFQGRTDQPVNAVNAALVAAERGIAVEEQCDRCRPTTRASSSGGCGRTGTRRSVAGTTIGGGDRHWLVGALGFKIEIELAPYMVFFQYDDRPGVIGRVGTLFGEAGINIANMAVSRTNEGGKALMALSIDTPAPADARGRASGGRVRRRPLHPPGLNGATRVATGSSSSYVRSGSCSSTGCEVVERLLRAVRLRSGSSASMPSANADSATMVNPEPFVVADVRGDDHPVGARAVRRRSRPQAGELRAEHEPRARRKRDEGADRRCDSHRPQQSEQDEATVGRSDARVAATAATRVAPFPGADVAAGGERVAELGPDEGHDGSPCPKRYEQEADRAHSQSHF